VPLSSRIL
jgi:hypothetical protein